jgi:hypothetical protein
LKSVLEKLFVFLVRYRVPVDPEAVEVNGMRRFVARVLDRLEFTGVLRPTPITAQESARRNPDHILDRR